MLPVWRSPGSATPPAPHLSYQAGPDELRGRVIAITGAGDGIGRAVALAAAAHGAELVLIGRSVGKLEAVHARIAALNQAEASIAPLDLERVRRGEPKYLLREVFTQLYPGLSVADKVAFARPMDGWMNAWTGPHREEFKPDLDLRRFSGEQKWLLYCLERFLDLMEDT